VTDSSALIFDSVEPALRALRFPVGNDAFIRRLTDRIGVAHFEVRDAYVVAVRRDGRRSLQIHRSGTNGFASEAEVIAACGDVSRGPSERSGLWRVDHPVQGPERRPATSPSGRRPDGSHGACPGCFTERSVTGACSCG
jgi:hypothetical protein